jgi:acyl transferase domain-containing protein
VGHAQVPFAEAIDAVKFKKAKIPVYSNSSGEAYPTTVKSIRGVLKEHILNSVRFTDELKNIHAAGGRIFVEFGPKKVLAPMVDSVLEGKGHLAISVNPNPKKSSDLQLRLAAIQLAVAGVSLSNLDPFAAEKPIYNTTKLSPLKIRLSAQNYLSEGFVQKRDAILDDGFTFSTATPEVIEKVVSAPESGGGVPGATAAFRGSGDGLEQGLALFYQHERATLKIHEQYLETPKQYADTFQALMQQQLSITQTNPGATMAEGVERSLMEFHENHSETLRVHEKFLEQQAETSRETLNLMKEHYSLLTGAPVAAKTVVSPKRKVAAASTQVSAPSKTATLTPAAPVAPKALVAAPLAVAAVAPVSGGIDLTSLTETMLGVVAEKTGYPTDMLELGMDMEADLGIDSIKRVEILGAVQEDRKSVV